MSLSTRENPEERTRAATATRTLGRVDQDGLLGLGTWLSRSYTREDGSEGGRVDEGGTRGSEGLSRGSGGASQGPGVCRAGGRARKVGWGQRATCLGSAVHGHRTPVKTPATG